jgi:hypothetical protein
MKPRVFLWATIACAAAAACSTSSDPRSSEARDGTGASTPATSPGAGSTTPPASNDGGSADAADGASDVDEDGDGIPDAREAEWASAYLPLLSIHPSDGCKTHGILYRLSPHPKDAKKMMMRVVVLFDEDCGANGHAGDDEVFGVVFDPQKPAPAGILAVRAISHQGTPCERTTTCGSCRGLSACSTATKDGAAYPVVYPSKDKHGLYVDKGTCSTSFVCDFGGCSLATSPPASPMVNAGEPGKPLVTNLTTEGFVTAANGWTKQELMNFDPWKPGDFGGAGDVSNDLVDDAFVVDCP